MSRSGSTEPGELEKLLAREQLTSRFYKQCEETAQQQLAALNKEVVETKKDAAKKTDQLKKAEEALTLSRAQTEQLTAHCRMLQSDLADRAKKFEAERLALQDQLQQEKAKVAKRDKIEERASKLIPILEGQIKTLTEVVSGKSEAHAAFALQCSREFDAVVLEQRCADLTNDLKTSMEELDHATYLYREEKIEAQRVTILYHLHREMLDLLTAAKGTSSGNSNAAGSPGGIAGSVLDASKLATNKSDELFNSSRGKMEELAKENAELKRSQLSLTTQMTELRSLSSQTLDQNTTLRKLLDEAERRELLLKSQLATERAEEAVRQASSAQRQLEQGAVVGLLSSCLMQPLRCPHCSLGLGDTIGLEMVAGGLGLPSVDAVLTVMVESLTESVSREFHDSLTDIVTRVAPAVTLSAATGLASNVPQVVMFLPPSHFAQFIDGLGAVSEAQCYALCVKYLTTGARFVVSQANVDLVLDAVRFLWLPAALVESEISRIESDLANVTKASGGSLGLLARHGGDTSTARHLVPHGLLLRLVQTLRFKSVVVQAESLKSGTCGDHASLQLSSAVVHELQRIRNSYGFIPTTMRPEIRARAISTPSLLSLQLICI